MSLGLKGRCDGAGVHDESGQVVGVLKELFERALCRRWSERRVGWQVRVLRGHSEELSSFNSVAFSRDGKWVVSGSDDDLKIWDVATGAEVRTFEGVRFALPQTPKFRVERYCSFLASVL